MNEIKQLEDDLGYVRGVVEDAGRASSPAGIYLLWAVICLVGFPLADFAPEHMARFWFIVGPVGWVFSAFLGWRASRRGGQMDRAFGMRHLAHWAAMLVTLSLGALMLKSGMLTGSGMGAFAILVVGLTYVLGALHLDRLLLWPGLLMLAGYVVLIFVEGNTWTIVGVLVSAGLGISAMIAGKQRAVATT